MQPNLRPVRQIERKYRYHQQDAAEKSLSRSDGELLLWALVGLPMTRGLDDAGAAHAVPAWATERRGGQGGIVGPPMSLGAGHELTNRTDRALRPSSAALHGATP